MFVAQLSSQVNIYICSWEPLQSVSARISTGIVEDLLQYHDEAMFMHKAAEAFVSERDDTATHFVVDQRVPQAWFSWYGV